MIHTLLGIALAVFVAWIILQVIGMAFGGLIHLLWIVILVALAVWLWRLAVGRDRL